MVPHTDEEVMAFLERDWYERRRKEEGRMKARCMLLVVVAFVSLFFAGLAHAQPWAKTYGSEGPDDARVVKQTPDGGYIVAGMSQILEPSDYSPFYVWVLKLDRAGNIEWQKAYKGPEKEGYSIEAIDVAIDGGYILAGSAMTCYEDEGPLCITYGWLLKIDANGGIVWQRAYKGGANSAFSAVQQTTDGGYVAAGRGDILGMVTPYGKLWIVKLDDSGAVEWQKTFDSDDIADSYATSVQQTMDGGYIVAGSVFGTSTFTDWYDIWVIKLDGNGNVQWHKMFSSDEVLDIAWSVRQTNDGGYIVAGQTQDSIGYGMDGLLLKLDRDGNIEWQKNYESGEGDSIRVVRQTDDGGYIFGGLYSFGGLVVKTDQNGDIEWQKRYKSNQIISIEQTVDRGYIMASSGGGPSVDFLVLKTDENGNTSCPVENAEVQVYSASLTPKEFSVTPSSLEMRIRDTIAVPMDTNVSPKEACYTLTVTKSGTGSGTVTSDPAGIDCGSDCSESYAPGTIVALTANPDAGSIFAGWGGACAGQGNPCTLTLDADTSVTVTFTPLPDTVTIRNAIFFNPLSLLFVSATSTAAPDASLTVTVPGCVTDSPMQQRGSRYVFFTRACTGLDGQTATVRSSFGGSAEAVIR